MWSRFLRRYRLLLSSAIAVAVIALIVLVPRVAHAQAVITIYQEQSLPRFNPDNTSSKKRGLQYTPEGVNYDDCVKDLRIGFPLQLANFEGNATVEVWAGLSGNACTDQTSRTGTNHLCWSLATGISLTTSQTVYIPVRTIMSGALTPSAPVADASVCGKIDLTTISVNFLYFGPGDKATPTASHPVSVQIDTVGPAPPTGLTALPGNTRLQMSWDNISGEGGVSVLTGIQVFCDPNNSQDIPDVPACQALRVERGLVATDASTDASDAATTDAATSADATTCVDVDAGDGGTYPVCTTGTGATGATTSDAATGGAGTCASSNLAPTTGAVTPSSAFNQCFSCGSITGNTGSSVTATSLRGDPLANDTHYALAVAATDAYGNTGPLSAIVCEYPEPTNDFWEAYRNAGGKAGGGCDTGGDLPAGSFGVFGGATAVALSLIRRRRRRNAR